LVEKKKREIDSPRPALIATWKQGLELLSGISKAGDGLRSEGQVEEVARRSKKLEPIPPALSTELILLTSQG